MPLYYFSTHIWVKNWIKEQCLEFGNIYFNIFHVDNHAKIRIQKTKNVRMRDIYLPFLSLYFYWQIKHEQDESFIGNIHNWLNDHIQKHLITGLLRAMVEVNEDGLQGCVSSSPWIIFSSMLRMKNSEFQYIKFSMDQTLNNSINIK